MTKGSNMFVRIKMERGEKSCFVTQENWVFEEKKGVIGGKQT